MQYIGTAVVEPEKSDSLEGRVTEIPRGVRLSNTDPQNLSAIHTGCDWLKLVFYGNPLPAAVLEELKGAKERALSSPDPVAVELGGRIWQCTAKSSGKGRNHFHYLLRDELLTIGIAHRDEAGEDPVMFIEASGKACRGETIRQVSERMKNLAQSIGVRHKRVYVSRCDVQIDVSGLRAVDVKEEVINGRCVTRFKRDKDFLSFFDGGRTVTFGKYGVDSVCLKVYDKRAELLSNPEKRDLYPVREVAEELPESLTRFEITMGGQWLRQSHSIEDLDGFLHSVGTVVTSIMTTTIRFCEEEVDRNNSQKYGPAAWWQWVTSQMTGKLEGYLPTERRKVKMAFSRAASVKRNINSRIDVAIDVLGRCPADMQEVNFAYAIAEREMLLDDEASRRILERYQRRCSLHAAIDESVTFTSEGNAGERICERAAVNRT